MTPSFFSWFYVKYPFWVAVWTGTGVMETWDGCALFVGAVAFVDFVAVPFVMKWLEK